VAPDSIWEIVFLMVILKIPIVYLCWVIWWAIKSPPDPEEHAAVSVAVGDDEPPRGPRRLRAPRRLRPSPGRGPVRTYPRTARAAATARAKLDR
jgi:hypothetical protein